MKTKRKPLYGILLTDANGEYWGFIDASLWSRNSIMLYDYDEKHFQGIIKLWEKKYGKGNVFITRIHSKNCPINVNYKVRNPQRPRNHAFTIKGKNND